MLLVRLFGASDMKYTVLFHNGITFDTMSDASAYAQLIFQSIGIVPAIVLSVDLKKLQISP